MHGIVPGTVVLPVHRSGLRAIARVLSSRGVARRRFDTCRNVNATPHSAVACRSAYMANDQRPSTSAPGKRPTTSSGTRPGTAPVGSKKTKVVRKPKPWTPPQKGWNDRYSVGVFPPAIPTPPLREPIPLSSMDLKNSCSMKLINPPHMMTTVKPTNAVPVMDIPLHITPHPKPGTVHARVGTFTKTLWAADEKARLAAKGAYERASQRARESSEREQLWNDRAVVGEISNKFIGKRLSDLETTFYAKRNLMGSKVNSTHIYDAVFPCKPD